jgi:DNA polymerase I-like protein with 3'-5' exonuclease and polymerase domains/uracil-DNA glycosylase
MQITSTGPTNAKIAIVGEFPHEQDLLRGMPFCGGPGLELSKMLAEAGIHRESCYVTMVMNDRVAGSRVEGCIAAAKKDVTTRHVPFQGKMVLSSVVEGAERLKKELELLKPNVVCAVGNLSLFVLTGQWGVNDWRSSIMESTLIPGLKVIPTLSPAVLFAQWSRRPLIVHDLKRVARQSAMPGITRVHYSTVIRPSFTKATDTLRNLIEKAECAMNDGGKMKLGADIETRAGHIACIAFAWSKTEAICIPLMCQHNPEGYWSEAEEAQLVMMMCVLMSKVTIIGQNWNYDAQYIYRHWHFLCPDVEDTMIMQHSCFSSLEKNLSFLSSMYLEDHLHWKDDRTNWTVGPKGEGEDKFWDYNCTDAIRTLAIYEVLTHVVKSMGMVEVNAFQQSLASVVLRTLNLGIRMDQEARAALSIEIQQQVLEREQWLLQATGQSLNIKSPKQMQEFFYLDMGQKEVKIRRPGGIMGVTTNDEALHKIAAREPILLPVTRKIAELRSLGVFHSTFVQVALDVDQRLRTDLKICGTETYRFASSKNAFGTGTNFQNIPKGGETEDAGLDLPNVRKLFIPDPGYTMFDIDLDSADLRIVTWESDCKWMKDHFANGRKPYIEVMREYFKDNTMTKHSHPREYAQFKSLCHGTNYLGTADGIAPRIGLLVHETERIQKWYFGLAPEIRKWQEDIKKQVSGRRYVENVFGYRMYFFDKIEGTIFNQAVAWIPQSSVGCLINRAYVNIDKNLPEVEVLLQVHDSLMGQFESVQGDWALRRIVEESQVVLPYADPLVIPVGIVSSKTSWGACG